ncbi:MAG: sulfate reduction electron transfer complex DsrMKJOP subunit DsrM [Nitrospirae bacterium]|nr:sulfate reduction electron transfer complex DsrMKJOP subunit DsrM [Nitrospirota bacterium]
MGIFFSFSMIIALVVIAFAGVQLANMQFIFGVVIPYAAIATFLIGVGFRVYKWGRSPVPFRIPTTCGQQKSLPWIKHSRFENPDSTFDVVVRMALEVFLFRTLFRNLKAETREGRVAYGSDKWLWLAGLALHVTFFVVLLRHLRFFMEPVPFFVNLTDSLDGFMQVGTPHLLITGVVLLLAAVYLFFRRISIPQVRYISLPADYFPLFLIMSIAISGILMRYFTKVDLVRIKALTMGLVTIGPVETDGIGAIFFVHIFLISILLAYFPFSKLMHMGGVFLSPTRNMANNSRIKRHINPWNYPVKVHTYEEYEEEFRDKMKSVGLPLEKE